MGQRKKFDKAFKEQVVLRILADESTIGDTYQVECTSLRTEHAAGLKDTEGLS